MFEGLIAKLALGAAWSRVKTNASHDWQAIPPKARLWIMGIVAAIVLIFAHQWYAHHELKLAKDAAYKSGYAQAVKDIQAVEAKKVAPLKGAKTVGDAKIAAFNEGVKKSHDSQNAHIDRNVTDLLGMFDNQAAGRNHSAAGGGLPGADGATGSVRAETRAPDGLGQGSAGEPTITLPAREAITRFGICDRDYTALTAWEDSYRNYVQVYDDWLAKTKKVAPAQ